MEETKNVMPKKEIINDIEENKNDRKINKKYEFNKKISLLSHMDSVRGVIQLDKEGILASASEDCLLKLWNIKEASKQPSEVIEPYITLRGHVDPIFTICQSNSSAKESLIYTAGSEGQVRVWQPPNSSTIVPYGQSDGINYELGSWNAHSEAIWQVLTHPINVISMLAIGLHNDSEFRCYYCIVENDSYFTEF